ncbi:MAG: cysteine dioxygenase family protein [Candidatus Sericytochromatia bacterium]|nr:cysteine dioxygenase family protein [Candidatus Tanganyikabacteria bacterium]
MTWDEFMAFVAPLEKAELPLERLTELVGDLQFPPALIEPHKHFASDKYARNLMVKNHLFEAVCMCWEPGQKTVIHNHGDSFGVFYVYEGELFFNTYERNNGAEPGKARLAIARADRAGPGNVHHAAMGEIHEMGNHPEHRGRTVSIHFYAGPMERMDVFDIELGTVESVVLPYFEAPERSLA